MLVTRGCLDGSGWVGMERVWYVWVHVFRSAVRPETKGCHQQITTLWAWGARSISTSNLLQSFNFKRAFLVSVLASRCGQHDGETSMQDASGLCQDV